MGMFDTVTFDYRKPDGSQSGDYQTKDLDCTLDEFTITAQGRLIRTYSSDSRSYLDDSLQRPLGDLNDEGTLHLTGDALDGIRGDHRRFALEFRSGNLIEIRCEQSESRLVFEASVVPRLPTPFE